METTSLTKIERDLYENEDRFIRTIEKLTVDKDLSPLLDFFKKEIRWCGYFEITSEYDFSVDHSSWLNDQETRSHVDNLMKKEPLEYDDITENDPDLFPTKLDYNVSHIYLINPTDSARKLFTDDFSYRITVEKCD
jgi:hypothetical protein